MENFGKSGFQRARMINAQFSVCSPTMSPCMRIWVAAARGPRNRVGFVLVFSIYELYVYLVLYISVYTRRTVIFQYVHVIYYV